jgi:H+/Cl- antiporter ClcA
VELPDAAPEAPSPEDDRGSFVVRAVRRTRVLLRRASRQRYGPPLLLYFSAAAATGAACVLFMRGFDFAHRHQLGIDKIGAWAFLTTPALFILSFEMIRLEAPLAAGTGIPQTIFAARRLSPSSRRLLDSLLSLRTMTVKIAALYLAVWAGASTGREGPSVHVAACVFLTLVLMARSRLKLPLDFRSAVVAGGSAGLAAAFNTPLAGVTFAIEELSAGYVSSIRDYVIMAIIISTVAADSMRGEYLYFGKLKEPLPVPLQTALAIGVLGGLLGALFCESILRGQAALAHRLASPRLQERWKTVGGLALGLVILSWAVGVHVLGPGNEVSQDLLLGDRVPHGSYGLLFSFAKTISTLLTYWSGMAGGIFAPCLSIGSALGGAVGSALRSPVGASAMVGMAAFLAGAIQAPITSFVIIFEMTRHHNMLPSIMMGAVAGFMVSRAVGARHLYPALAAGYRKLLEPVPPPGRAGSPASS